MLVDNAAPNAVLRVLNVNVDRVADFVICMSRLQNGMEMQPVNRIGDITTALQAVMLGIVAITHPCPLLRVFCGRSTECGGSICAV